MEHIIVIPIDGRQEADEHGNLTPVDCGQDLHAWEYSEKPNENGQITAACPLCGATEIHEVDKLKTFWQKVRGYPEVTVYRKGNARHRNPLRVAAILSSGTLRSINVTKGRAFLFGKERFFKI